MHGCKTKSGRENLGMRLGVIAMAGVHTEFSGGGGENDVLINY